MIARRLLIGVAALFAIVVSPFDQPTAGAGTSTCYGTPANGRIEGAVRMPASGDNFAPYCWACIAALRTYAHRLVIDTSVAAYEQLATSHPKIVWIYGEIGGPNGGSFKPHRTHQNGLSVDYMVPVLIEHDGKRTPGRLPIHAMNRFGYDEDFDKRGRQKVPDGSGTRIIDFDAIAAHILALDRQARKRKGRVARVLFAPDLQDDLFKTPTGRKLRGKIRFNKNQTWVRHDDHYHVDFAFPCK